MGVAGLTVIVAVVVLGVAFKCLRFNRLAFFHLWLLARGGVLGIR
jgi:hypothetical protein